MPAHPPFAGEILPLAAAHRQLLRRVWLERWGGDFVVSRGQSHHCADLPGCVALLDGEPLGLVTYAIHGADCEVVTLDSLAERRGVGTALLDAVRRQAEAAGCARLWLVTSNDNLPALGFYQRYGFRLAAVHAGALNQTRRLKPGLPLLGLDGIPLRDELELELQLYPPKTPVPAPAQPDGIPDSTVQAEPPLGTLTGAIQPNPFPAPLPGSAGYAQPAANSSPDDGYAQNNPAGTRLARRPIYESRWVNLYLDHMRTPSGFEIPDYHVIDYPNPGVAVYVTNPAGEVLLGRYPRYVIGQVRWEVPAGGMDPGEDVLTAARREVYEETGYTLHNLAHYYTYHPAAGSTNKVFHLVRAAAGERTGPLDPHEVQQIHWFTVAELRQMIARQELQDGYTLTALLLAWLTG